ncbi:MAG: glycoside hydrolase [Actinomycetota bacterium]|nr:glycoside hydrolase [Actinomycetota bacterium]
MTFSLRTGLLAAGVIIGGALLSGCAGTGGTTATGASSVEFGHVHGLGVNPADGARYVASHEGLFRVGPDGRAESVGPTRDLMGFTVVGPDTFLSSGHPGPDEDVPNPLGLAISRDAGRSWTPVSLSGEVDFHSLTTSSGTIFGYDSHGLLLVSADGGRSWQQRAALRALDIAVDPRSPQTVLATTETGVATSRDGGQSFSPGNGMPLAYLSWPEPGSLYGLDTAGAVYASSDGGATWNQVGAVPGGRPQALTAIDQRQVLAATAGGVYESRDGGRTFAPIIRG